MQSNSSFRIHLSLSIFRKFITKYLSAYIYFYLSKDVIKVKNLWIVTLYGMIAGVGGTAAGGLLACLMPKNNKYVISFILEYSAGFMIAVVCFDLLPNAFVYASLVPVLSGLISGIAVMVLSESFINYGNKKQGTIRSIKSTGFAIALGVAIHNFPEGLAIGSGFEAEIKLGISLAIAIMLHNIPEGISIAVPLRAGGSSRMIAFLFTLASGLPMGLGALVGAWAGQISTVLISLCLSWAGGAMLYVIFADMIPESKRMYTGRLGSIGCILGLISGIIISVQL